MPPDGSLGSLLRTKPESDIHIGLRFRKKLFATFEASRHLHHNWKFPSEGALEAVAALFGGASISASDPRLLSDDKTRLDAHLRNVATKTNESARDVIVDGLPEGEAIRERLAQFVKAAANVDCSKCAGNLPPCCGQDSDMLRLSGEAQCWKFLRDVFDLSVLITNTHYDPIITINIRDHPVDLGFVTLPGADFSAQTGFRDHGRSHKRSVISIKLPFNRFNILTWLDLFQPLIHEVFVHAPQNFYLDGERRAHGEDCPFSEGYLDACAHKVLQTTLGSPRRQSKEIKEVLNRIKKYSKLEQIQERVDFVFQERTVYEPMVVGISVADREKDIKRARMRDARAIGRSVFQGLDKKWGGDQALRLGMRANLAPLDKPQRQQLVETLAAIVERTRDAPASIPNPTRQERERLLRQYASEGVPADLGAALPPPSIWG